MMPWNAPVLTTNMTLFVALFVVSGAPGLVVETALISALQIHTEDINRGRASELSG